MSYDIEDDDIVDELTIEFMENKQIEDNKYYTTFCVLENIFKKKMSSK